MNQHVPQTGFNGGQELSKAPAQFYVPAAASMHERRPRTLKHGDTFGVFDHNGDAIAGPGSPEGIYHRDTRYLSQLQLTLNGERPILLSSAPRDDNATLTCDLANPDLPGPAGEEPLQHDLIHVRRTRFLWNSGAYERVAIRNYDDKRHRLSLEIAFAADFADLFEVRGTKRSKKGTLHQPDLEQDRVLLAYTGCDERERSTLVQFDPAPQALAADHAVYEFELEPHGNFTAFIFIGCDTGPLASPPSRSFFRVLRESRRALHVSSNRATAIGSSSETFNETVHRCVADTYMLITDTPQGPYPYAGIPWFSTIFGRDALITALETLWMDPEIAKGVLRYLAANQAQEFDPVADAEPGKILHEERRGEMAELGEIPFRKYYGSIDSTPLFVMLAGAYLDRTGDLETTRSLWPNIQAALRWIDEHGDRDGDGFVEYGRRNEEGLVNQGWKDSFDSVFHEDGTLAHGPIALAEVQAYAYGALVAGATLARRLGEEELARSLCQQAEDLRARFDEAFFDEALGTYAIALDGQKRRCRVRSSNAGHALLTGLAHPERAEFVIRTLMSKPSFSGWGIRTIPTTEARYNPMSYHNGSIWPHDNALIAAGMNRYGYRREAAQVFSGLVDASNYVDLHRLPELFCGFSRRPAQGPTFYPVACIPQAWAAAAPLYLVQSCLGLGFDPANSTILFDQPVLPPFLDGLTLRRLAIGTGSADVALRRSGEQVVVDVLERTDDVSVIIRA
ncbi:glycogen debranching N-terminal domain-containing protein [Novosphingobium sp. M1R2S20]|uniref:Glycogen debranching N-terminal domain-containing protein n=1 Tax=Novosphingobium rhizovicinum TaxID=3228928 RepID=A0ABV3RG33_9SPHN